MKPKHIIDSKAKGLEKPVQCEAHNCGSLFFWSSTLQSVPLTQDGEGPSSPHSEQSFTIPYGNGERKGAKGTHASAKLCGAGGRSTKLIQASWLACRPKHSITLHLLFRKVLRLPCNFFGKLLRLPCKHLCSNCARLNLPQWDGGLWRLRHARRRLSPLCAPRMQQCRAT